MEHEHFVRTEDSKTVADVPRSTSAVSRFFGWLANKPRPKSAPDPHPYSGFNANGRRHS